MKIHGTAKGGALSTKDFGVAFGGVPAVNPWLSQDTAIINNTVTNKVDFDCQRDDTNNALTYDIGTELSATWVMRFILNFATNNASAENWLYIGFTNENSDSDGWKVGGYVDSFGGFLVNESALASKKRQGMCSATDSYLTEHQNKNEGVAFTAGTDYYFVITRTGTTTGSVISYTDGYDVNLHNSFSYSSGNDAQNLQFFRVSDIDGAGGSGGGTFVGTIEDIGIDDDTTTWSSATYTINPNDTG